MPGALVVDDMCLEKTCTSGAVAMLCNSVTEKVVMGLPQCILWGNTLEEWMMLGPNTFPGIVGEEQESYPFHRLKSVLPSLLRIQSTPPLRHPAQISALEPILVVTMAGVAETFKSVINKMTHGTVFKVVIVLQSNNANITAKDLNTSIDKAENRWNIHLVPYNTWHSEQSHQVMANSPTVHGVLRFLMSPIGIRLITVLAGKLR
jgi:hypothetical protein